MIAKSKEDSEKADDIAAAKEEASAIKKIIAEKSEPTTEDKKADAEIKEILKAIPDEETKKIIKQEVKQLKLEKKIEDDT